MYFGNFLPILAGFFVHTTQDFDGNLKLRKRWPHEKTRISFAHGNLFPCIRICPFSPVNITQPSVRHVDAGVLGYLSG